MDCINDATMTSNETTSLLPTTVNDCRLDPLESQKFDENGDEVAKMKRVTHNDPHLGHAADDYKNLLGSTRLLYNNIVWDEMTAKLKHQSTKHPSKMNNDTEGGETNSVGGVSTKLALIYHQQKDHAVLYLEKVKHSFFEDAKSLAEGTIPQSVVLALGALIQVLWSCR